MTLLFIRMFFVIITTFVGYYVGEGTVVSGTFGLVAGFFCGLLLIALEASLKRVSVRGLSSMVFGLLLGIVMAKLITDILSLLPLGEFVHSFCRVAFTLIFSYLGAVMALRGKDEFHLIIPYVRFKRQDMDEHLILLDTSALIDGRIADICRTSFFTGRLVIPRFVLQELQKLADSKDRMKRQKGRRGLEVVRGMQKNSSMSVQIHEDDVPGEKDTDSKLVRLAKILDAKLCTTDYNLGRVSTIQGVEILNINELVEAVRPVMMPGEELEVRLVKEGKEPHQAVAYTGDGTLIVVSDARQFIGKMVMVTVASVLQTQGGRIIFAKLHNRGQGGE